MTTMNADQESVMSRVTKLLALAADEGASRTSASWRRKEQRSSWPST
jgi:hypothetical protein